MPKVKNKNVESQVSRNSVPWFGVAVELTRLSAMTPRQIADDLLARGCQGTRGSPGWCPLAVRFRRVLRLGDSASRLLNVGRGECCFFGGLPFGMVYSHDNPQSVQAFVAAVDDGCYPDLARLAV